MSRFAQTFALLILAAVAMAADLPSHDTVQKALRLIVAEKNGGFGLHMWATLVNRDGDVKVVTFSGTDRGDQWPGSRVISARSTTPSTTKWSAWSAGTHLPACRGHRQPRGIRVRHPDAEARGMTAADDVGDGARGEQPSAGDDRDGVGDVLHLGEDVAAHEDGLALLPERPHRRADVVGPRRVPAHSGRAPRPPAPPGRRSPQRAGRGCASR